MQAEQAGENRPQNSKLPRCVWCGKRERRERKRKHILYAGRFCNKDCAARYGVSIAQTKEWDAGRQEWTAATNTDGPPHGRCDACGHPNAADGSCSRAQCCNAD